MAKQTKVTQEKSGNIVGFVRGTAQKVFLLGLGAAATTQDGLKELWKESGTFTNKLVERGDEVVERHRGRVSELIEKPQSQAKEVSKKAGETFEKYTDQVLTRVNVPLSDELEALSRRFTSLNRKIDRSMKEQQEVVLEVDEKVTEIDRKLDQILEEREAVAA